MPSTYLSLYYHLVFGTKHREPLMVPPWRAEIHEYLGGTIAGLGGVPQGVGGVADHVHLLVGLRATHRLCDVVQEVKKASSMWVHRQIGLPSFAWQEGYSAFTVSPTVRGLVQNYIARQEEHHRVRSSQEELAELLAQAGAEFDPNCLD
ncbi:MAG: Transposase like protein [Gemmataceae bacterium]|nr:Transposase like protein [Gemmataceae bacterium]